jgi:hypothetical protein
MPSSRLYVSIHLIFYGCSMGKILQLCRRFGGTEAKLDFAQFASLFTDKIMEVFFYFYSFSDDAGIISLDAG